MGSLSLTGCGQTGEQQPGPVILQCVGQNISGSKSNGETPPMLEVRFSQPSTQSPGASRGRDRRSYERATSHQNQ